ncbi:MAG TPA: ligase-associated DNA damage response endonuclease PdeM [Parvularculaceae bacterium]|nr:ligase-associated DNA damage response endonuclease PdeM [Parvularculaceae bacterium]
MADAGLFIEVSRARLLATADGALYLPKEETLVVSDLHFEKGSAFAARGVLLPPYDTRVTLKRLAALVTKLKPLQVISLGDAFHDGEAEARMEEEDAAALEGLVAFARWTWVLGNHDPAPPKRFGGEVAMTKRIGRLIFRHEPAKKAADGEIAGHLHPCARIRTETRIQRRRCFASDGKRLVMPAFGAYAGGLNVLDAAFADILPAPFVFALGRARVYPIAPALLVADPPSAARLRTA